MKKYAGILKLALLVGILPWAIWLLALDGTLSLWGKLERGNEKLEQLCGQGQHSVGVAGGECKDTPLLAGGSLLEEMAEFIRRENTGVVSYMPVFVQREGRYGLWAGELVLTGKYAGLLRFTEALEKKVPSVKIVSAGFRLFRERYGEKPQLRLTLVLVQLSRDK